MTKATKSMGMTLSAALVLNHARGMTAQREERLTRLLVVRPIGSSDQEAAFRSVVRRLWMAVAPGAVFAPDMAASIDRVIEALEAMVDQEPSTLRERLPQVTQEVTAIVAVLSQMPAAEVSTATRR